VASTEIREGEIGRILRRIAARWTRRLAQILAVVGRCRGGNRTNTAKTSWLGALLQDNDVAPDEG
jgi:hypothetical protein